VAYPPPLLHPAALHFKLALLEWASGQVVTWIPRRTRHCSSHARSQNGQRAWQGASLGELRVEAALQPYPGPV
jgi:hypothetical protein